MTESGRKRLCACGCGRNVTRATELRHQQGKGPLTLASAILAQNSTLKGRHRKWKSAHQSVKHQLVGCHAPIRNALNASHSHAPSHNISGHFLDNDYPMDDLDAGPSGVHHDTPMPYSPPPIPHLLPLGLHSEGDVVSALSETCHSQWVAEHVDQIG